jgi:hypothetical protein
LPKASLKEALNKLIPFMPFDRLRRAFDKPVLSPSTRLRTGLSKDLIRASLTPFTAEKGTS